MRASFLLVPLLIALVQAQCRLCVGGLGGLKNPNLKIDERGGTCATLSLVLYSLEASSTECSSNIQKYRYDCCMNASPVDVAQVQRPRPVYSGKRGPYKSCQLCYNGGYPRNTAMVINMLYIGPGSCAQYYLMAEGGFIPNHLCQTLQYFAFKPCGC
jgi:hypothetical protein